MSKYEASALAQADAYEKERKKQADAVIAQITADADAKTQAAVDETGAAIRTEQRSLLDTVDAAAVERQVTLGQAKEALARPRECCTPRRRRYRDPPHGARTLHP